jgi:hypothetical protein
MVVWLRVTESEDGEKKADARRETSGGTIEFAVRWVVKSPKTVWCAVVRTRLFGVCLSHGFADVCDGGLHFASDQLRVHSVVRLRIA